MQPIFLGWAAKERFHAIESVANRIVMEAEAGAGCAEIAVGIKESLEGSPQATRFDGLLCQRPKLVVYEGAAVCRITPAKSCKLHAFKVSHGPGWIICETRDSKCVARFAVAAAEPGETDCWSSLTDEHCSLGCRSFTRAVCRNPAPNGVDVSTNE